MTELQLFKAPSTPKLGPRQAQVLAAIDEQGGLTDVEAGRIVHRSRYGAAHVADSEDACCLFCRADGGAVLASLRRHGLLKRRRADGVWIRRGGSASSQGSEIPY